MSYSENSVAAMRLKIRDSLFTTILSVLCTLNPLENRIAVKVG